MGHDGKGALVYSASLFTLLYCINFLIYLFVNSLRVFQISFSWWSFTGKSLLSILAVLNSAVVWMVSTRPPTSKSSSPFSNALVTVPKAPITIGRIVTLMFQIFFNSQARSRYLPFFSHSFSFIIYSRDSKVDTFANSLFVVVVVDYCYKVWSSGRD